MIAMEAYKKKLCSGCGICAGVCPIGNIQMIEDNKGFLKPVKNNPCNLCSLCDDVCPGNDINYDELRDYFYNNNISFNPYLGNLLNCYIGCSTNEIIRISSSSGGLVTELLLFLIEKEMVDGVLVTKMRKDNPLRPYSVVARSREDILSATGSKYCPVSLDEGITQIMEQPGSYAIVGLPCHLYSIRKAEMLLPKLKNRIKIHFGLFCGHSVSYTSTELLLKKLGINSNEVEHISYRGQGWPGKMQIRMKNKKSLSLSYYWATYPGSFFFTSRRCILCPDMTAELSDISFGDAWLPEYSKDEKGSSVIISRTKIGEEIIRRATQNERIGIQRISEEVAIESQRGHLWYKKNNLKIRYGLYRKLEKNVPSLKDRNLQFFKSGSLLAALVGIITIFSVLISESKLGRDLLSVVPLAIVRYYSKIISGLIEYQSKLEHCKI